MPTHSLYAIVLAAGSATRFGATKQLAKFAGEPLVTRAVRTAERVCGPHTVLVAGHDWQDVAAACEPLQGFLVYNPRFADGMSSSLRQGIRSVGDLADGILLMLADQPLVSTGHLESLVKAWATSPDSICASAYANTKGPPVVFPQRLYGDLMDLRGDRGARTLIDSDTDRVISIQCEDAAIDIDTPDDLNKMASE